MLASHHAILPTKPIGFTDYALDQPAVSVHVYRPALRRMTRYRLIDGRLRVAEVAEVGVAW
ncbi:hypothetical protein [Micromonospora sp. KC721]|uniref:hypothetical protein n=1 Tax=Micromonospora sp. KC721 TaxID=2530380 RepID=UPI001FB85D0A|nr:hypothetical protein [Micromonospora sp. KC721]